MSVLFLPHMQQQRSNPCASWSTHLQASRGRQQLTRHLQKLPQARSVKALTLQFES